jgi:pyrroline-5-carboxylate reductase
MARYIVSGTWSQGGATSKITVNAPSPEKAEAQAQQRGLNVTEVSQAPGKSVMPWIVGFVVLAALILVALWYTGQLDALLP